MSWRRGMAALAITAVLTGPSLAADGEAPRRVVSMNVCTDQLAMLIAGENQLYSVSYLASDPGVSVMSDGAADYVVNHGLAEEIHLMQPDLVVAGTFSTRTTVDMLKRLGIPVVDFVPEATLDDVRENMRRMGAVLKREERAAELIAAFDRELAALQVPHTGQTAAIYGANSYASGTGTLAHAVIEAAGFTNVTEKLGLSGTVALPLETLIMAAPDIIISDMIGQDEESKATENLRHPAFQALESRSAHLQVANRYWVCGGPFTLEALRILKHAAGPSSEAGG